MIKAVIFDLGDTLVLTDRWDYDKCLQCLLSSLKQDNVSPPVSYEEFKRIYFEIRNQMYSEAAQSLEEVDFPLRVAKTLQHLGYNLQPEDPVVTRAVENFMHAFIEDVRMEDYVPAILSNLTRKYKLGLVSNFAYSKALWKILSRFNIEKYFNAIVVSGEFGLRKPDPRIFQRVIDLLAVKPEEAIFVGDSLKADIEGAKKLDMKTILVENVGLRKNPYAVPGELDSTTAKPDCVIPSLRELPQALTLF